MNFNVINIFNPFTIAEKSLTNSGILETLSNETLDVILLAIIAAVVQMATRKAVEVGKRTLLRWAFKLKIRYQKSRTHESQ